MEVVIVLAMIGLGLVAGALLFFCWTVRARDYQFADRIALMPMDDDAPRTEERKPR